MTHRYPWLRPQRTVVAALTLTGLLAATSAHAQTARTVGSPTASTAGQFVVRAAPGGGVACEDAPAALAAQFKVESVGRKVHLTPLPRLNGVGSPGLKIVLRATDQLIANPAATLAFRRAAARWEEYITSPVTVVLDVDFGPLRFGTQYPSGVLGSTSSAQEFPNLGTDTDPVYVTLPQFVQRLKDKHPGDAQLQALYDAIPLPVPTTARAGVDTVFLGLPGGSQANLQALGYRAVDSEADATLNPFGFAPAIGFNSGFAFDLDPADGITAGQTDFDAVVTHEIGHALGFVSIIGNFQNSVGNFYTLDLFRVRPGAVTEGDLTGWHTAERIVTPGPARSPEAGNPSNHVFFDGIRKLELSTATGSRTGGDAQQASHWRNDDQYRTGVIVNPSDEAHRKIGIMDPTIGAGERIVIKDTDLRAMEVIGYGINYTPTTAKISTVATDTLKFGDLAPGATANRTITFSNLAASSNLIYESSIVADQPQPSNGAPTLSLNTASGTVAPSANESVTLTVGAPAAGVFSGVVRLRTNDPDRLFIEVPYLFTVGGATAPRVVLASNGLTSFGDVPLNTRVTKTLTLTNAGSLPLTYSVDLSYSTVSTLPINTTPDRPRQFRTDRLAATTTVFSTDFESGAAGFTPTGPTASDWNLVTSGKAASPGHSTPTAFYFGRPAFGTYRSSAYAQLVSPSFDLSATPPSAQAELKFNYYLDGEKSPTIVYDIAYVLMSTDGGQTYKEIGNSKLGGVLLNSTAGWQTATFLLSGLSGANDVRFAFRFTSDSDTETEGWYIDDVSVGYNAADSTPLYATPTRGSFTTGSANIAVTVDGNLLPKGIYNAVAKVTTNDRKQINTSLPFSFTVGGATYPQLVPATSSVAATVTPGDDPVGEFTFSNSGSIPLRYLRVIEPALSRFTDPSFVARLGDGSLATRPALGPTLSAKQVVDALTDPNAPTTAGVPTARVEATGDSLYSRALTVPTGVVDPNALSLPGTVTQAPNGTLYVADLLNGGKTVVLTPGLQLIRVFAGPNGTGTTTGIAYDDRTNTLWYVNNTTKKVVETDTMGVATGRSFTPALATAGAAPWALAYSAELDALMLTESSSFNPQLVGLMAYSVDGTLLPGYPSFVVTSAFPGMSMTRGVIEVNSNFLQITRADQFGRAYATDSLTVVTNAAYGVGDRIYGLKRSRINPNGIMYYVFPARLGKLGRIVAIDPVDLPTLPVTHVKGNEALGGTLAAGATKSVGLRFDVAGLAPGQYNETLAFITNNPADRIVRVPVQITVAGVVPVEIASFSARAAGGAVELSWATASEKNNAGFSVQRQSGSSWTELAFVSGHNTTTEAQAYRYTDRSASVGTIRYRLVQRDLDGTETVGPTVEATTTAPKAFALLPASPNPFNPTTMVSFTLPVDSRVTLAVYNTLGQQVKTLIDGVEMKAAQHQQAFDAGSLPTGVYLVRLTAGSHVATQRVMLVK